MAVLNAPGIVDAGYQGDVGVVLINHGIEPFEIKRGDRIAQLLIEKLPEVTIIGGEIESPSDRGEGGFGSTGTK